MRLDLYLRCYLGVPSREKAQEMIQQGMVLVGGQECRKNSFDVSEFMSVVLTGALKYVSRGGQKLECALDTFEIDPTGLRVLDVGASTGGFTDCLLQRGATEVFALDVGHCQLAPSLRANPRVRSFEGTHIRDAKSVLPNSVDLLTCDVSFISLTQVISYFPCLLCGQDPRAILLIKPQFEVRHKKSVVRDPKLHRWAITEVLTCAREQGFVCRGLIPSPIRGEEGNTEYLLYLGLHGLDFFPDISAVVFSALEKKEEEK